MLQNLLGTPVSGLVTTPAGTESRGDGLAKNLDSNLGKFDKSLILNEPGSATLPVAEPATALGGEPASNLASLPDELLGSLRASLQALLNELYPGKEFPPAGNLLPNAAPLDLAAALERVVELQSALQSLPPAGPGGTVAELDASGAAELARQLEAVLAELEPALVAMANTAVPVATMPAAARQGLDLPAAAQADSVAAPARAMTAAPADGEMLVPMSPQQKSLLQQSLVEQSLVEQVRGMLAGVRDVLQRALPPGLQHAASLANAAPHGERGASGPAVGLALAAPDTASSALTSTAAQASSSALARESAPASALAAATPALRGNSDLSAARGRRDGVGAAVSLAPYAAPQAAGSEGRIDRSAAALPVTLLPAVEVLRAAAMGAAGFELRPSGQSLEPLAAAMQTSSGLWQPAAAQATATPQAGAHTFTTSVGLPVVNGQWGSQIAQRITWLTGQGINTADIHLNPPELGPMQVRIDSSENAARVTISVHNAMTREALEMQLPRLRDLFAEQGLELVDVDVENRDFAGDDSQSAEGDNDNGDEAAATPENTLVAGVNPGLANAADSGAATGDTIVLHYALVDAYA